MSSSAFLAITAWSIFICWLAYQLALDLAEWWRTQRRGHERAPVPVAPRPAWLDEPEWSWPLADELAEWDSMASQIEEIRALPEHDPRQPA